MHAVYEDVENNNVRLGRLSSQAKNSVHKIGISPSELKTEEVDCHGE